jgi:hypothetical protein
MPRASNARYTARAGGTAAAGTFRSQALPDSQWPIFPGRMHLGQERGVDMADSFLG